MAAHVYEGMFILDSNRYAQDSHGVSGQIAKSIEQLGGEVLVSRLWDERRLAYPINGHRKGTYWLTYFRSESDQLVGLNRQLQLNDNVIRSLVLKVDPRIADTLVQYASSNTAASPVEKPATAVDERNEKESDEAGQEELAAAGTPTEGRQDAAD